MSDYKGYIKCGEILKSPTINEKDKYEFVFKCHQCFEDHYILLDSFILPPCIKKSKEEKDVEIKYEDIAEIDEVVCIKFFFDITYHTMGTLSRFLEY